jgi:hypothetical protein
MQSQSCERQDFVLIRALSWRKFKVAYMSTAAHMFNLGCIQDVGFFFFVRGNFSGVQWTIKMKEGV